MASLGGDEHLHERSLAAIEAASAEGSLVICDLVYAELCAQFPSSLNCTASSRRTKFPYPRSRAYQSYFKDLNVVDPGD
jgi:hypothetical protein